MVCVFERLSSLEMKGCWHESRLVKLLCFASKAETLINPFDGVPFFFLSQNGRIYGATHM